MTLRFLLLLPFILLFHKANSQCNGAAWQCNGNQSYTATPAATGGQYAGGTVVTFCYTMEDYNQCNSNWLHTIQIDLDPGWDASSLTPVSSPVSCDGQGNWGFYSSVTSVNTNQTFGPCFSYDSPLGYAGAVLEGIPGNNFGDNCTMYAWTFCFSVMVAVNCSGQSLAVNLTA